MKKYYLLKIDKKHKRAILLEIDGKADSGGLPKRKALDGDPDPYRPTSYFRDSK